MVLKTAEGISGIAEEGRGLTYLYIPQNSWQAGESQPCRPLTCAASHVTHGLPRALARLPLTLAFLGCL